MRLRPPKREKRPAPPTSNLGTDRSKNPQERRINMSSQSITPESERVARDRGMCPGEVIRRALAEEMDSWRNAEITRRAEDGDLE